MKIKVIKPKVWRVENSKGGGCYWGRHTPIGKWLCNRHNGNIEKYPTPQFDEGIERSPENNEICAFLNKKQAEKWFNKKELKKIIKEDFLLREIEVETITAYGKKQILCIR